MELILDTTFLIDLEREIAKKSERKPAIDFILKNPKDIFQITIITVGEFAEGFKDSSYSDFRKHIAPFQIIQSDQEVAWIYGQITKSLRQKGGLIGTNDLWIAAIALRNNKGLVTRNVRDFKKIADLNVISY